MTAVFFQPYNFPFSSYYKYFVVLTGLWDYKFVFNANRTCHILHSSILFFFFWDNEVHGNTERGSGWIWSIYRVE